MFRVCHTEGVIISGVTKDVVSDPLNVCGALPPHPQSFYEYAIVNQTEKKATGN